MFPIFPTVEAYSTLVNNVGWDTAHSVIRDVFGLKAANDLDIRFRNYTTEKES